MISGLGRAVARSFRRGWLSGQIRNQPRRNGLWWAWPAVIVFLVVGVFGLVRSVYLSWWLGISFTLFWMAALVLISAPDRRAWLARRISRRDPR